MSNECDTCANYSYDEEYYRNGDEYQVVRHQM